MDQDLSCCICLKRAETFSNKHKLREHYKEFHRDCNKRCKECHNQFKTQDLLASHMAVEHGKERKSKKIFCVHCNNKSFIYYFGLESHYNIVHPKYSFKCSKCGNCFLTESIRGEHAVVHRNASKDPFVVSRGGSA